MKRRDEIERLSYKCSPTEVEKERAFIKKYRLIEDEKDGQRESNKRSSTS